MQKIKETAKNWLKPITKEDAGKIKLPKIIWKSSDILSVFGMTLFLLISFGLKILTLPSQVLSDRIAIPIPTQKPENKISQDSCNTENNFEKKYWDNKNYFRTISTDQNTEEPEFVGAKITPNYQSQMIYKTPCKLPLTTTVSAVIRSYNSSGLTLEYENVIQTITGDGDLRSIRYKINTSGDRKQPWTYLTNKDGSLVTDWLPANISYNSQIDIITQITVTENIALSIQTTVTYKPEKSDNYKSPIIFPAHTFKVESFNVDQNIGQKIRVGITDDKFKGLQSEIKFLKFSINGIL